jgi:glycosyltransferase involved in cell wall biosynthesis
VKILSFIVPSYNSQKYLDKCVKSLLHKDCLDKTEVIIVNDGSFDNTEKIAKELCKAYPQTIRLISQENRGHGGALNTGIAAAKGKYLKVIDADDWIETQNLPRFINLLEKTESDVVLTHHYTINITTGETKRWKSYPTEFGKAYSFKEITENWSGFDRSFTFHGITYRTRFYHSQNYKLCEKVFYEDHEYSTFPACFAQSVTPFDIFIYDYRIGDIAQSVSDENQLKRASHTQKVLCRLMAEYKAVQNTLSYGAKEFIAQKTKILLLSYLATLLLVEKDKKKGRKMAAEIIADIKQRMPSAWQFSHKQYKKMLIMNRLHISKKTFDKLLSSKIYRMLKGSRKF